MAHRRMHGRNYGLHRGRHDGQSNNLIRIQAEHSASRRDLYRRTIEATTLQAS